MGMTKNDRNDLTTFGLLRHGQTEWNKLKKIQGSSDSPLTSKGQEMTAEWSLILKKYNWHRIFASDMGRVKETVSILNRELNVPVKHDKRLREQFWGDWEGLTLPYVKDTFREELGSLDAERLPLQQGLADVEARIPATASISLSTFSSTVGQQGTDEDNLTTSVGLFSKYSTFARRSSASPAL